MLEKNTHTRQRDCVKTGLCHIFDHQFSFT